MGLFDSIAGQVVGAFSDPQGGQPSLVAAIGGLIGNAETGGLPGLISAFEQHGLGGVVASWVGTGQNLPISADQLQSVLGNEQIQALAQKFGISTQDIAGQLATMLPQVVDKLTPTGSVPADGGGLASVLGGLMKMAGH